MAKYRDKLPQLNGPVFLTDAGLETVLIFHEGIDLPSFAAFHALQDPVATDKIRRYYSNFADLAREFNTGLVLETLTWRASREWAEPLGYTTESLAEANRASVELLLEIRDAFETKTSPMVISGAIGPRGDGYVPSAIMSADEAQAYHSEQIKTLADTEVDFVTAFTINYIDEGIGVARAAKAADLPVVISFTVETDGNLPTGQTLGEAITAVDKATDNYPVYHMINCAHPSHFESTLDTEEDWINRIGGLRANASCRSHEELNESETLDDGNPAELGHQHISLSQKLPNLKVVGGCCGTDIRHVRKIAENLLTKTNVR